MKAQSVLDSADGKNVDFKAMVGYWQKVGNGQLVLNRADINHLCGCLPCQEQFMSLIIKHHLKITPEMMAAINANGSIIANDLKQQVVRALCLRAVGSTLGN